MVPVRWLLALCATPWRVARRRKCHVHVLRRDHHNRTLAVITRWLSQFMIVWLGALTLSLRIFMPSSVMT
jgi:hypothetical protein